MEIIVTEENKEIENYKVGDVFLMEGTGTGSKKLTAILVKEGQGYILRTGDLGLWTGYNGYHESIENLFDQLDRVGIKVLKHYSRDDYELHLVNKEEE